ncbi:MAG TPA: tRNA (adenosine(37)-N6)-dimethylallyltransferase MiaA [Gemmatimonadaceae bacterium]|nr:tRNA (adenosine(37)-N6)-dimethylallyltransferase MiaA [Gemmatimonadaceae bacterium]
MSSSGDLGGGSRLAPRLVVVCGPTAAGKSALAMQVASALPMTVISADSRQIYRHFDIGTAKPTPADRAAVPHEGLDLVEPTARYSAFSWAAVAGEAMATAVRSGRLPVVVGGAGFYIRALVTPAPDTLCFDVRYLLVDPGPPLRGWIEHRVDAMWAVGWPDEVRRLIDQVPANAPAWQASGYAAVREMVAGRLTAAAAREQVIIATRQYAKRQRTWFRHQLPADRVIRLDPTDRAAATVAERLMQEWYA